jgi:hypothetical protein
MRSLTAILPAVAIVAAVSGCTGAAPGIGPVPSLAPRSAAAPYIRPRPAPGHCPALAARHGPGGVWWGRFAGERENIFDQIEQTSVEACFTTAEDCRNWLYWMQSDYPLNAWIVSCTRGYPLRG